MSPHVSVVIPTRNRPQLVCRGIRTVLTQTFRDIEVIVVIDGPDPQTVEALKEFDDSRLKIHVSPESLGPAGARNQGVSQASGEWVAFLDDDDEWFPSKLEKQVKLACASSFQYPIVSSYLIARTPKGDFTWPRRIPNPGEPVADYLFVRNSPFLGEGFIQTSTLLTKRDLLIQLPLDEKLSSHEDWDWLIKVKAREDVSLEFVQEPLAIWYAEGERKSQGLSNSQSWRYSLDWVRKVRSLLTRKAYSSFLMLFVGGQASSQFHWKAFFILLIESIRYGSPRALDYALYFTMWLFPISLRRRLRALFYTAKSE